MEQNTDDVLEFGFEKNTNIIKVLGVGGGGGNAVNHMFKCGIKDVDFVLANTDNQALDNSEVQMKIQLGSTVTEGLGAGNNPERGENAAIESIDEIKSVLGGTDNTKMIFITAGMGGGTGTGAAPIIAKEAKDEGVLTVAIVTVPFRYEGPKRLTQAKEGLEKLRNCVDSLLVIDNQKILQMYGDLTMQEAFAKADDILTMAAKGIAEIITVGGIVNVDFADVKSVMQDSGIALMGNGQAEGEDRAPKAIKAAINSPLLNNNDIFGAKNLLINISSSSDPKCQPTLKEIAYVNEYIQAASGNKANLIWGHSIDDSLGEKLSVTVIATGFPSQEFINPYETEGGYKTSIVFPELESRKRQEDTPAESAQAQASQPEAAEQPAVETAPAETVSDSVDAHQSGEEVDLGDIDESIYDDIKEEEEDKPVVSKNNEFKPIDYSSIYDLDSYDRIPAYKRKGIELNIGNYNDSKCQKSPLVEF